MIAQVCQFSELPVGALFRLYNAPERVKYIAWRKTLAPEKEWPPVDNAVRIDRNTPAWFAGYSAVIPLDELPTHQPVLFLDELEQAKQEFEATVNAMVIAIASKAVA